ncbi:MAG: hypothetical protein ACT4TC_02040 [Myxococcaceae bacterium]
MFSARAAARALLLVSCLSGCRNAELVSSTGMVIVDRAGLYLGPVFVGATTGDNVTVTNLARYSIDVSVALEGPFTLVNTPTSLVAGEARKLTVRYAPSDEGIVEGKLVVTAPEQKLTVTLKGEGASPLSCEAENPCRPSAFDPIAGKCIESVLADGAACGENTRCLQDGRCSAGECVGNSPNCDDGNACTADACDVSQGCVHFDNSAGCPGSGEVCQVPECNPATGCGYAAAQDGLRCGVSDCNVARVCLLGTCQQVAPGEGSACGDLTPCQKRGVCTAAKTCDRPAPSVMIPLWDVPVRPGYSLLFDSIADPQGNVYWRECANNLVELVSVTRDGLPRYRVPTLGQCVLEGMVYLDGTLLVDTGSGVQALQGFGGAPLWKRELLNDATAELPPVAGVGYYGYVIHLSRGLPGTAVVALEVSSNGSGSDSQYVRVGTWLFALDLYTGELKWKTRLDKLQIAEMLVDEMSNLYLGTVQQSPYLREFFAFTPQGVQRWRKPNGFDHPAAVYGGRIYHWNQALSDTATGKTVGKVTLGDTVGYPRLTLGAGFYVTAEDLIVPQCGAPMASELINKLILTKYDPATAKGEWTKEIVGAGFGGTTITNTLLTNRGSILFSQSKGRCAPENRDFVLREISASGEELYQCALPGPALYQYYGMLIDGMWAAAYVDPTTQRTLGVRAFAVPGLDLNEKGWAAALGSMARDHRPR